MQSSILLQPAFILHYRPYRDTSLLIELLTLEHGRVSVVARGVRAPRSRLRGILQPFVPLFASWVGKTELVTLRDAEINGLSHHLLGQALLSGLYLNELLMRVLHRFDAYPNLYHAYQASLQALSSGKRTQQALRIFEKTLLLELGYALQLDQENSTGLATQPELFYYFEPTRGINRCPNQQQTNMESVFTGQSLLAIHYEELTDPLVLQDAKRLMRLAFAPLLGNKPLRSRELFIKR